MSFTDVYVGSLDDPTVVLDEDRLNSEPDLWNGSAPRALSPFWPHPGAMIDPFRESYRAWPTSKLEPRNVRRGT